MDINLFTQRLKEAREKEGLSLKDLQARVGISLSALNNYVAGRTLPPLDVAARLAEELHVSLDWLSGMNSNPESKAAPISNCHDTAEALDQIISIFQAASIQCEDHLENPNFSPKGIILRIESPVLFDYYYHRRVFDLISQSLAQELKSAYASLHDAGSSSLYDHILDATEQTGLK